MAWVTEYDLTWKGLHSEGTIELQRDGATYIRPLKLIRDSLSVTNTVPDWENPIMKANCSFAIQNDFDSFYDALPLMTISNGQYRVIVEMTNDNSDSVELFIGYLNCEAVGQVMVDYQNIQLTASGLIKKLENDHPPTIDTAQDISLIDIIDACLVMTGSSYNIRVSCSLYETESPTSSTTTLFNLCALNTELFWKNNKDRESSLDILTKILTPFNCILYWYQGYWYIEHYEDLGDGNKDWVEYTTGASYGYSDDGVEVPDTFTQQLSVHDSGNYEQVGEQQMLSVNPGLRQYDISFGQNQYYNIFNGDLTNHDTGETALGRLYPPLRTWYGWQDSLTDWFNKGESFLTIANSTTRQNYDWGSDDGYYNGLTTRFMVTINEDTELTIKFKIGIPFRTPGSPAYLYYPPDEGKVNSINWWQYWFLKTGLNGYFYRNPANNNEWEYNFPGSLIYGNYEELPAADFDLTNPVGAVQEITLIIPIGQAYADAVGASNLPVDVDLVFRAGIDLWREPIIGNNPSYEQVYGDFHAAVTDSPDDNLLEGEITTDFLDKKSVTLDVFDTESWNYRNTILSEGTDDYGSTWFSKTSLWSWGSGAVSLARRLMESKFRLYRVARQIIKVAYIFRGPSASWTIRPLMLYFDNKQSLKKFVVLEDRHLPESDTHEVKLFEYDDTETITLI